ncbi:hypothetical protein MTO96_003050 [Rhipicephalus appendiculatus]
MKSLMPDVYPDQLRELNPLICYVQCLRDHADDTSNASKKAHIRSSAFKHLKNESCVKNGEGFAIAVSLQDGTIIYVSGSITSHLGYSKDMLLGQCIMNFLYPPRPHNVRQSPKPWPQLLVQRGRERYGQFSEPPLVAAHVADLRCASRSDSRARAAW